MARTHYNVAPRYSAGSPAQVGYDIAMQVVDDERRGYEATLAGAYGPERAEEAQRTGLAGIVEERIERADAWLVTDLITGHQFVRMFPGDEDDRKRRLRAFRLQAKYHMPVE